MESINNSLAHLPGVRLIPHSVALHYKSKDADVRKIADTPGVQTVLSGSVVQRGDELSIGVELDDVQNGRQLWGERYNRKLADLLTVQNDIAWERLLKARKSGELSKDINVDDYARYLSLILAGLSIQAANGSTKAELKRISQMGIWVTEACGLVGDGLEREASKNRLRKLGLSRAIYLEPKPRNANNQLAG